MPAIRTRKLLFVTTILVAIGTVFLAISTPYGATPFTQKPKLNQDRSEKSRMPVAAYSAKQPADPVERELRLTRGGRFDNRAPVAFSEMRPDTTGYSTNSHWWLGMPALPTAESDAVIIGNIVTAEGYLSNDRTGAYSEFTIRSRKAFKDDGRLSGGLILAEREGAVVQLHDGRTIRYGIAGQGMPQIGGRYVLFLKYNEQAQVYDILTGYELRGRRVFSLDNAVERFTSYENAEQQVFLSEVQTAISHPPKVSQERPMSERPPQGSPARATR